MIKIGNKEVGQGYPTFIIGEAGLNHNGDIKLAKQLVDVAFKAGCDAVKFQTFNTKELSFKFPPNVVIKNITDAETIELKKYCDEKGIIFFSSPHTLGAIDFLNDLVPVYKIASRHITNDYFLKRVRVKGKPVIAAMGSIVNPNGMASREEVNHFLNIMAMNNNLALLYCISKYPCYNFDPDEFSSFLEEYSNYPIGISCHSPEIAYSLEAVELGACIVEKHITLDKDFDCVDKKVSIPPEKLEQLVKEIRIIDEENDNI